MTPIFNRQGRVVAWLNSKYIYEKSGRRVLAFVHNNATFNYRGQHLGRYTNGFFRDRKGYAVAFTIGAMNGPLVPITEIPPIPPIPAIPPIPPIPSIPSIPPINSFNWSSLTWNLFMG